MSTGPGQTAMRRTVWPARMLVASLCQALVGLAAAAEPAQTGEGPPPGCEPGSPQHCATSPDGRLVIATVLASERQEGRVQLWTRVGLRWRMLYRYDPAPGMGFDFKAWRADGAAVRLTWACHKPGGASGATQLRDGPYGWDLIPPPPDRCAE